MNRLFILTFLISSLLFTNNAYPQGKKINITKQIESVLESEYHNNAFNGNILVVQNGIILYEKSFGYADAAKEKKLNKNYKFQIGSIYKEFVAISIMQLFEKKEIKLEDKVSKYIPELPSWAQEISIKNLLQYSSGLPDIQYQKYPIDNPVLYKDIFNDIVNTRKLLFEPGTSYFYTNYSPLLLMKVVENVSRQTFSEYAKQHLFHSDDIVILDKYPYDSSEQFAVSFDKNFKADKLKISVPFLFASNLQGLYNWFKRIHQNEIISQSSKLFLGKTADVIFKGHMESPLGIVRIQQEPISGTTTVTEHTHDGTFLNFRCIARRFNNIGLSIIILTNQNNDSDKIYKIVTEK